MENETDEVYRFKTAEGYLSSSYKTLDCCYQDAPVGAKIYCGDDSTVDTGLGVVATKDH